MRRGFIFLIFFLVLTFSSCAESNTKKSFTSLRNLQYDVYSNFNFDPYSMLSGIYDLFYGQNGILSMMYQASYLKAQIEPEYVNYQRAWRSLRAPTTNSINYDYNTFLSQWNNNPNPLKGCCGCDSYLMNNPHYLMNPPRSSQYYAEYYYTIYNGIFAFDGISPELMAFYDAYQLLNTYDPATANPFVTYRVFYNAYLNEDEYSDQLKYWGYYETLLDMYNHYSMYGFNQYGYAGTYDYDPFGGYSGYDSAGNFISFRGFVSDDDDEENGHGGNYGHNSYTDPYTSYPGYYNPYSDPNNPLYDPYSSYYNPYSDPYSPNYDPYSAYYNPYSDPYSLYYMPGSSNPYSTYSNYQSSYYNPYSDPYSAYYDPYSPYYNPISDPYSAYYDPYSAYYNPFTDPYSPYYDPNLPNPFYGGQNYNPYSNPYSPYYDPYSVNYNPYNDPYSPYYNPYGTFYNPYAPYNPYSNNYDPYSGGPGVEMPDMNIFNDIFNDLPEPEPLEYIFGLNYLTQSNSFFSPVMAKLMDLSQKIIVKIMSIFPLPPSEASNTTDLFAILDQQLTNLTFKYQMIEALQEYSCCPCSSSIQILSVNPTDPTVNTSNFNYQKEASLIIVASVAAPLFSWRISDTNGSTILEGNQNIINIPAYTLLDSAVYTVQINATSGTTTTVSMTINTATAPSGGILNGNSTNVSAVIDNVLLTTSGWSSTSTLNYYYGFYEISTDIIEKNYPFQGYPKLFGSFSSPSTQFIANFPNFLTQSTNIILVVFAIDQNGLVGSARLDVTVNNFYPTDPNTISQLADNLLGKINTTDPTSILRQSTLVSSMLNLNNREQLLNSSGTINNVINEKVLASTTNQITTTYFSEATSLLSSLTNEGTILTESSKTSTIQFLTSSLANSDIKTSITTSSASTILSVISNLIVSVNSTSLSDLVEMPDIIIKSIGTKLALNTIQTYETKAVSIDIRAVAPNVAQTFQTNSSDGQSYNINFPGLENIGGSSVTVGFKSWKINPYQDEDPTTSILSNVMSLDYYDVDGSEISVSNLQNPIVFTYEMNKTAFSDPSQIPLQKFYDKVNKKWSDEGCYVVTVQDIDSLTVQVNTSCNHLTDFALSFGFNEIEEFSFSKVKISIPIIIAACLAVVMQLVCGVSKDHYDNEIHRFEIEVEEYMKKKDLDSSQMEAKSRNDISIDKSSNNLKFSNDASRLDQSNPFGTPEKNEYDGNNYGAIANNSNSSFHNQVLERKDILADVAVEASNVKFDLKDFDETIKISRCQSYTNALKNYHNFIALFYFNVKISRVARFNIWLLRWFTIILITVVIFNAIEIADFDILSTVWVSACAFAAVIPLIVFLEICFSRRNMKKKSLAIKLFRFIIVFSLFAIVAGGSLAGVFILSSRFSYGFNDAVFYTFLIQFGFDFIVTQPICSLIRWIIGPKLD